jgi:hypothetical protein
MQPPHRTHSLEAILFRHGKIDNQQVEGMLLVPENSATGLKSW